MTTTTSILSRFAALGLLSLLVAGAGCAAAKPSTKAEMSDQAKDAPPPPKGDAPKVERKVTTEASADFKAALEFYEDKAKDGVMTNEDCIATAKKFEDVARSHDKLVEAWFNAGVAYHQCRMTKEAEEAYQQALKINPKHGPSLANLGEIYFQGGNEKRALEYFDQAKAADGTLGAPYVTSAWIQYNQMRRATGDAERTKLKNDALFNLKNALAVDNDNVQARVLMAMVYMEDSDKNKNALDIAALLLDGVAKNKPELKEKATPEEQAQYKRDLLRYEQNLRYPLLYNAMGLLQMKRGNVGKALGYFRQAVELDGTLVEARMNLAFTVLSFRKYDEAEANFRAVLKLQPKNYDAINGLGMALRGQSKIDEAETTYNQAISVDKDRGSAFFNLGVLYKDFRTNDPDDKKALEAYKKAKTYFVEFQSKGDATATQKADAKENVETCDKGIKTLESVIAQKAAAPEPAPAPAPAPAK